MGHVASVGHILSLMPILGVERRRNARFSLLSCSKINSILSSEKNRLIWFDSIDSTAIS